MRNTESRPTGADPSAQSNPRSRGKTHRLLVVARGVARQLEYLGGEVLHDRGQVDCCAASYATLRCSRLEQPMDAAYRKLQSGAGRARLGLLPRPAAFGLANPPALGRRRVSAAPDAQVAGRERSPPYRLASAAFSSSAEGHPLCCLHPSPVLRFHACSSWCCPFCLRGKVSTPSTVCGE